MTKLKQLACLLIFLTVTACGGGGGASTPASTPAPQATNQTESWQTTGRA